MSSSSDESFEMIPECQVGAISSNSDTSEYFCGVEMKPPGPGVEYSDGPGLFTTLPIDHPLRGRPQELSSRYEWPLACSSESSSSESSSSSSESSSSESSSDDEGAPEKELSNEGVEAPKTEVIDIESIKKKITEIFDISEEKLSRLPIFRDAEKFKALQLRYQLASKASSEKSTSESNDDIVVQPLNEALVYPLLASDLALEASKNVEIQKVSEDVHCSEPSSNTAPGCDETRKEAVDRTNERARPQSVFRTVLKDLTSITDANREQIVEMIAEAAKPSREALIRFARKAEKECADSAIDMKEYCLWINYKLATSHECLPYGPAQSGMAAMEGHEDFLQQLHGTWIRTKCTMAKEENPTTLVYINAQHGNRIRFTRGFECNTGRERAWILNENDIPMGAWEDRMKDNQWITKYGDRKQIKYIKDEELVVDYYDHIFGVRKLVGSCTYRKEPSWNWDLKNRNQQLKTAIIDMFISRNTFHTSNQVLSIQNQNLYNQLERFGEKFEEANRIQKQLVDAYCRMEKRERMDLTTIRDTTEMMCQQKRTIEHLELEIVQKETELQNQKKREGERLQMAMDKLEEVKEENTELQKFADAQRLQIQELQQAMIQERYRQPQLSRNAFYAYMTLSVFAGVCLGLPLILFVVIWYA